MRRDDERAAFSTALSRPGFTRRLAWPKLSAHAHQSPCLRRLALDPRPALALARDGGRRRDRRGLPARRSRRPAAAGARRGARGARRGTAQPTLRGFMPDPSMFRDMDKAAERLADAVEAGEAVTIFGDYDVDGATSAALLIRLLRELGLDAQRLYPRPADGGLRPVGRGAGAARRGGRAADRHRRLRRPGLRGAGAWRARPAST